MKLISISKNIMQILTHGVNNQPHLTQKLKTKTNLKKLKAKKLEKLNLKNLTKP